MKPASAVAAAGSGSARIRCSWVGTRETNRTPAGIAAAAAANRAGVNGVAVSSTVGVVPSTSERCSTCSPATWWAGKASNQCAGRVSSLCPAPVGPPSAGPPPASTRRVARAEASRAPAGSSVPLGAPVEPEVVTTKAVGSSGSSSPGASAPSSRRARAARAAAGSSPAGTGSNAGPSPSRARANRGSRSSTALPVGSGSSCSARAKSVGPGVAGEIRGALLQERVPPLDRLVGAVGQPGRLAGEQLLADQPVVDQVEGVLEHPLRGR